MVNQKEYNYWIAWRKPQQEWHLIEGFEHKQDAIERSNEYKKNNPKLDIFVMDKFDLAKISLDQDQDKNWAPIIDEPDVRYFNFREENEKQDLVRDKYGKILERIKKRKESEGNKGIKPVKNSRKRVSPKKRVKTNLKHEGSSNTNSNKIKEYKRKHNTKNKPSNIREQIKTKRKHVNPKNRVKTNLKHEGSSNTNRLRKTSKTIKFKQHKNK